LSITPLKHEQSRDGAKAIVVSNIQRFSVHDGPGIRTVVFVQGCPLRCKWCQNPEDMNQKMRLMFYRSVCVGCGACIQACPHQANYTDDQGMIQIDRAKCRACGECVKACPAEARKMSGELMTVDQVMQEVVKDEVFFRNTGGGVTLSGGEISMFPDFASELLSHCQRQGIHTAIETCGHAQWDNLWRIAQYSDLILYDLKLADQELSKQWTGVDGDLILYNAKKLTGLGKKLVVRIPLIPGVNDTNRQFNKILDFAKTLDGVDAIHILPFHQIGSSKYEALDLDYGLCEMKTDNDERIKRCKGLAEAAGFRVSLGGTGFNGDEQKEPARPKGRGFIYDM
jgi:pyruvate formate lyase activating enzyme